MFTQRCNINKGETFKSVLCYTFFIDELIHLFHIKFEIPIEKTQIQVFELMLKFINYDQ